MNSNQKKSFQLGMSLGKASGKLRRNILFNLLQKYNEDICYRCGEKIETVRDLSIEHKIPWLDSEDPVKLFFDLENIAFSHLSCNSKCKRIDKKRMSVKLKNYWDKKLPPEGMSWCGYCKTFLPKENFSYNKGTRTKTEWICKKCRKILRSKK